MNREKNINYDELYDSLHPGKEKDGLVAFFNPELEDLDNSQRQEDDKNKERETFIRLAKAASAFVSPVEADSSDEQLKNDRNLQIAIAESLFKQANADSELDKIVGIFESSDIPNFAKQYISFCLIHPNIKEEFLEKKEDYRTVYSQDFIVGPSMGGGIDKKPLQGIKSPTLEYLLKHDDTEQVKVGSRIIPKYQSLIYSDLLKCEIGSGGDSIKHFVQKIRYGEDLMRSVVNGDLDENELSLDNKRFLISLLEQLESLYAQIDNGEKKKGLSRTNLRIRTNDILQRIKPTSRYDLSDRIVRSFFYPNGIKSANQLLQESENAKSYANLKNKKAEKHLSLKNNDLIKILKIDYLGTTIKNGILAKEYLGVGRESDYTPLDIDFYGYLETGSDDNSLEDGIYRTIDYSVNEYMGLTDNNSCFLIVRKDDRFEETKDRTKEQKTDKYELFRQGILFKDWLYSEYSDDEQLSSYAEELELEDEYYEGKNASYISGPRDYGVRTGLPSSEIDAIVVPDEKNKYSIIEKVRNNSFYIPIYNLKGELVYPFEEYYEDHHN